MFGIFPPTSQVLHMQDCCIHGRISVVSECVNMATAIVVAIKIASSSLRDVLCHVFNVLYSPNHDRQCCPGLHFVGKIKWLLQLSMLFVVTHGRNPTCRCVCMMLHLPQLRYNLYYNSP